MPSSNIPPKLPRIGPRQALQYRYYVIPQVLITDPIFANIDCAAKLIYAMLLNRLVLSAENPAEYTDDEGQLFVVYTVEEFQNTLHLSKPTVVKMLNQLTAAGLIEKKRQGQGKPTYLYVNDFTAALSMEAPNPGGEADGNYSCEVRESSGGHNGPAMQKSKELTGRSKNSKPQEVKKIDCSKNDLRKNECRNIPSFQEEGRGQDAAKFDSENPDLETLTENVKDQIEYNVLADTHGREIAQCVLSLIVGVLTRKGPSYLGKNEYPEELVKQRFKTLEYVDIDHALHILYQTPGVRNQTAYLQTLLFNAPGTAEMEASALFAQNEQNTHRPENRNQFRFF